MRAALAAFGLLVVVVVVVTSCAPPVPPPPPPAAKAKPIVVHDASTIRRVCVQRGLGAPGTGGGSIVFVAGSAGGPNLAIDTVYGEQISVPGATSLCLVPEQKLRVCPEDAKHASMDVAASDGFVPGSPASSKVKRGAPLAFYEYVAGKGPTQALVSIDGKARFIPADDVCHPEGTTIASRATAEFKMDTSAPGGPKAFRPRSTDAIKRIVIHNTEVPLLQTLHIFGRPEANTSAHVVIDRDGSSYRVIEDAYVAFHAGSSKDSLGGHNTTSLGIEVVAYDDPMYGGESKKFAFFSDAQKDAVIRLVDFWMKEYHVTIAPEVMANRATNPGYADVEYGFAGLTIHRLTKADRGTDCPRLLFPQSPEGDEQFFRWRESTFSAGAIADRARR